MNKKIVLGLVMLFTLFLHANIIQAEMFKQGKEREGCTRLDLEEKFFHKAQFLLEHQGELNITEEQKKAITDLKLKIQKEIITKKAEIDVIALDIKQKVSEETLDEGAVNALIDQKYEIKKAKEKLLVNAYAGLKGILTEAQKAKMKEIWKSKRDEKEHGMMKGKMKHPKAED